MKYIFIDSTQYRMIFSRSEGFSEKVYKLLIKLIDHNRVLLLLPQQTRDEVERNRFREWPEGELNRIVCKIQNCQKLIDQVQQGLSKYKDSKKVIIEIKDEQKKLESSKQKIKADFKNKRSKPNQMLKKLFEKAISISESEEIIKLAQIRHQKGNPPHDSKKIGDAIIWESLLSYLEGSGKSSANKLFFISLDKKAWGEESFDQWLQDEFNKKVGGKIIYINRLSDIPDLTKEEQESIRKEEREEQKENAVIDFVNSPGWHEAGRRIQKILHYKDILTEEDFNEIIKASISNIQI